MKKKYLLVEFCIVFFFLLLPPIFSAQNGTEYTVRLADFMLSTLARLFIALVLHIQCIKLWGNAHASSEQQKKVYIVKKCITHLKWGSITFGLLMIVYALFETVSLVFKIVSPYTPLLPAQKSAGSIIVLLVNLVCAAYYEEVVYRFFLPEALRTLLPAKKIALHSAEVFSLVAFALAHRYLGIVAVLNAFICGFILRVCYKRSSGIMLGTISHLAYNVAIVLFVALSN